MSAVSGAGYAPTLAAVTEALPATGWVVLGDFLAPAQLQALRTQALAGWQQGSFSPAGIGKGGDKAVNASIRGDAVLWLEDGTQDGALGEFQGFLEELRLSLNRELLLGLFESETHFALYPPGSFYRRHIDNFRGTSARLVTLILYLNEDWQAGDGGELRLYTDGENYLDIPPLGGQLVVFLSRDFYHEVLPTQRERLSLTGWLRQRG